jgi:endonuclease YncB( thermonuclease family)
MRKTSLVAVVTAAALSSLAATAAASPADARSLQGPAVTGGAFTHRGTVTHIVDGDTLDVRLTSGKTERIRLIGIDTPERGVCYFSQATARARQLAMSKHVVLRGDPTQDTRDRYGRLLAYVWLPGGKDLGYQLIAGGFAKVYVYRNPFQRLSAYRTAGATAKGATAGQWKACAPAAAPVPAPTPSPVPTPPTPAPPASNCHSSYSPCLPIVDDLDCADIRAMGVAPVRVLGSDPYRLDGDNDGLGCE